MKHWVWGGLILISYPPVLCFNILILITFMVWSTLFFAKKWQSVLCEHLCKFRELFFFWQFTFLELKQLSVKTFLMKHASSAECWNVINKLILWFETPNKFYSQTHHRPKNKFILGYIVCDQWGLLYIHVTLYSRRNSHGLWSREMHMWHFDVEAIAPRLNID